MYSLLYSHHYIQRFGDFTKTKKWGKLQFHAKFHLKFAKQHFSTCGKVIWCALVFATGNVYHLPLITSEEYTYTHVSQLHPVFYVLNLLKTGSNLLLHILHQYELDYNIYTPIFNLILLGYSSVANSWTKIHFNTSSKISLANFLHWNLSSQPPSEFLFVTLIYTSTISIWKY